MGVESRHQARKFFGKYWMVFTVFLTLQVTFDLFRSWSFVLTGKNDHVYWDIRVTNELISYGLWALGLIFLYRIYLWIRPLSGTKKWFKLLIIIIIIGFVHAFLQQFTYLMVYETLFGFEEHSGYADALSQRMKYFIPSSFFSMVEGFYYFSIIAALDYYEQHRDEKLRSFDLKSQLSKSRLDALQAQLNPHFLFNALNTISMMVRSKKDEKAITMISSLSDLLRTSLQMEATEMISLESELKVIATYLEIEQLRFSDRLTIAIEASAEAKKCLVPNLILQPVLENAFKYGVTENLDSALIRIEASVVEELLIIQVSNNGNTLPEGWNMEHNKGIGLTNVQKRLAYTFDQFDFNLVYDEAVEEVVATIKIPRREA